MIARYGIDILIGIGVFFLLAPVVFGILAVIWSVGEGIVILGCSAYYSIQDRRFREATPESVKHDSLPL